MFHHFSGPNAVGFPPNWRFGRWCSFEKRESSGAMLVFPQTPFQPSRLKFKGVLSKGCKKKCWSNHHHPLASAQFLDVRIAVRSCGKEMWLDWNKTRSLPYKHGIICIYIYMCLLTYSHDMLSPKQNTKNNLLFIQQCDKKRGHIRVFNVSGCWHCGVSWWAWRFTDLSFFNDRQLLASPYIEEGTH